jgi:hypothetical protein
MNGDCHFLSDFFAVLPISLVWLCVFEILESVGSVSSAKLLDDLKIVLAAPNTPVAPYSLIFLAFSSNLRGAPIQRCTL